MNKQLINMSLFLAHYLLCIHLGGATETIFPKSIS